MNPFVSQSLSQALAAIEEGDDRSLQDCINEGEFKVRDRFCGAILLCAAIRAKQYHLVKKTAPAVFSTGFHLVKILLEEGADPNYCYQDYPLALACQAGDEEMFLLLSEFGARCNLDQKSSQREIVSPLMAAASRGHTEMVAKLLAHGADPCYETYQGNALHLSTCYPQIFKMIHEAGASLNILDREGRSPLKMAFLAANKEVIEYIQSKI